MRNIKYIIQDIREATENQDVSEFIGISDREILRIVNEAQDKLQAEIVKRSPKIFTDEITIDCNGSDSYPIPSNAFLGNKITDVKYRSNLSLEYERRIDPDYVTNLIYQGEGHPLKYMRRPGRIVLQPNPRIGQLRVTYVKRAPKLDLQRGVVEAVTLDTSTITSLQLNVTTEELDIDALNRDEFLTVVDSLGTIKMANVRFSSINTTTGVVTLHPTDSFSVGETIEVGDLVVSGKYSSTHSIFDESIERYIQAYAELIVYKRDGSSEIQSQIEVLSLIQQEIIESYAQVTDDLMFIPDINEDWDAF